MDIDMMSYNLAYRVDSPLSQTIHHHVPCPVGPYYEATLAEALKERGDSIF
jgi:hypothetical protein